MDWTQILVAVAGVVTAFGGVEAVKLIINRKSNRVVQDANAFDVERKAIIEDYKRVQEEVDQLKQQVAKLFKEIDALKDERLKLISENNDLRLQLKEAENKVCLRPDDMCLQRLNPNDKCRLRKLLRGDYEKDHPGAIITEEDMKKEVSNGDK